MFDIRGRGGSRPTRARGIRSRRSDPVALHARRGSCETKSATHLWTHVVRLAVPRVGPAFPAVRCVVPGLARDALPRETRVSAPKRAAADVTRPRGPLPRDARLIGTPRRDRRGRFLRGGPHRPRQARQPLRDKHHRHRYFFLSSHLFRLFRDCRATGFCSSLFDIFLDKTSLRGVRVREKETNVSVVYETTP